MSRFPVIIGTLFLATLSSRVFALSYDTPDTHLHLYANLDWRHGALLAPDREDDEILESTLGFNTEYGFTPDFVIAAQAEGQLFRFNQNPSHRQMTRRWLGLRLWKQTEISYGLSENPFTQLTNFTNIFNAFGGRSYLTRDNIDNQIRLRWHTPNWDVRVAHADGEEARNGFFPVEENQISSSVSYRNKGLGTAFAAQVQHNDLKNTDVRNWAAGINFISRDNRFYTAATYGQAHYEKSWNIRTLCYAEAVGGFQSPRWFFGLGYNTQRACDKKTIKGVDEYIAAAQYTLTQRSIVYAEYLYDNLRQARGNRFALGVSLYL